MKKSGLGLWVVVVIFAILASLSGIAIRYLWDVAGQIDAELARPVRYGGQVYPGEMLLQGAPWLWGEGWDSETPPVEHTVFSSGTEGNQALLAGDVDVNVGSDSKSCALFAASDEIVIIGTLQRGDRYSTIVRLDSGYEDWADLKGQTVGTRLGTGAEQVLLRYFDSRNDLSWDDYEWVNVDVGDMGALLEAGQIEAFTAWEPTPAIAEANSIGRVLMSYGDVALVPVSVHTTQAYLDANHDKLVALMQAHQRKVDLIESNPEGAAQLAANAAKARGVEVLPAAFEAMFRRIDFSLEFDVDALLALQNTCAFLVDQGKIEAEPEIRWTAEITDEALR